MRDFSGTGKIFNEIDKYLFLSLRQFGIWIIDKKYLPRFVREYKKRSSDDCNPFFLSF